MNVKRIIFIFVLLLLFVSCKSNKIAFPEIEKPKVYPVNFISISNNICMDKESSENLLKNLYEKDKYIEKLELLIKDIEKELD
jgi:hypothetical protein